jgi:AcrR family transcriptional regulator
MGSGPFEEGPPPSEERQLLIDSFTRLAAESGYDETTGEQAAISAGLAPEAFYRHFPDELRCLVAAHGSFCARLFACVEEAAAEESEWPARVRRAVAAALEWLREMESRARLFFVEALALGPPIVERGVAEIDRAAEYLREGRRYFPAAAVLPEATEALLLGGAVGVVTSYLLAERASLLPSLADELSDLLLFPYLTVETEPG